MGYLYAPACLFLLGQGANVHTWNIFRITITCSSYLLSKDYLIGHTLHIIIIKHKKYFQSYWGLRKGLIYYNKMEI